MTGPEHYREAERLLEPRTVLDGSSRKVLPSPAAITCAQVHATLALAAATIDAQGFAEVRRADEWQAVR